jgi:hypothetical protein
MKALRSLLADRKRRQSGSVLSAVLILTAFLGIIAGALTTEISTNFILSSRLVDRVSTEATVNSAAEMYINQLQQSSLSSGCPGGVTTPLLNSQTAVAGMLSCWPTVYEATKFNSLTGVASQPFNIDGTHATAGGLDDYVIGNPDGRVYDYRFGSTSPRWTLPLGANNVKGPTLVMNDPNSGGRWVDLVPTSGSLCSPLSDCVSLWSDDGSNQAPDAMCAVNSSGPVISQPAASPSWSNFAYFGGGQDLTTIDLQQCEAESTVTIPGNQPVVGGPVALQCGSGCGSTTDEVIALVSDGSSSRLVRYTYRPSHFNGSNPVQTLNLPWGNASGLAISGGLPASMVITFGGGGIALVQISGNGTMTLPATRSIGSVIAAAPYWCAQCGGLIGVGAQDGLHLFSSGLNPIATYSPGGVATNTTPQADGTGNWYFGTIGGYVYEVQYKVGQAAMTFANSYGPMAQIGSSVQVGSCNGGAWICVYAGALNNRAYLVPLDSLDAVVTACIGTSPMNCTVGANPRLWTRVEVGTAISTNTVHVEGWSYYFR